jgi:ADP-ribose pyrophosphatase YjhB (NUDIX family)
MLCQWLPENEPNVLPPNASHQVGVGAFVYDREKGKVLVVQEKQGPLKGKNVWKMPTGLVCQGEDVSEAAVREVQEETGVRATFTAVLAMRQAHGFAFGKSDMFFVVACEPISGESDKELKPQEEEIEAASWILLDEFMNIEFMKSRPLYAQIMKTCGSFANGTYKGISGSKLASGSDREDLLLFGEEALLLDDDKNHEEQPDAWIGL